MSRTNLEKLKEVHQVQGYGGNWTYSEYMWGMYNGLELALSIFEDREPNYKEKPKRFGNEPIPPKENIIAKLRKAWF